MGGTPLCSATKMLEIPIGPVRCEKFWRNRKSRPTLEFLGLGVCANSTEGKVPGRNRRFKCGTDLLIGYSHESTPGQSPKQIIDHRTLFYEEYRNEAENIVRY